MDQVGIAVLTTVCTVLASLIVTLVFNLIVDSFRKKEAKRNASKEDAELLKKALQALLRNQLYEIYDQWKPQGWAPKDVKENFENLYQNYHALGQNGVMDTIYHELMGLPSLKPHHNEEE